MLRFQDFANVKKGKLLTHQVGRGKIEPSSLAGCLVRFRASRKSLMKVYQGPETTLDRELRCIVSAACSLTAYLAVFGSSVNAATIDWGSPTNISGDSDVSTNGTLLSAVNPGLYGPIGKATTVNGVNFIAWATGGSGAPTVPSGVFTLTPAPGFGIFTTSGLGSAS